jgi:hypothetical protein
VVGEIITGTVLAVVLFGLAGFTLWWQLSKLRRLASQQLPDEETHFLRRQAGRRLATAGLLLVLAILLAVGVAVLQAPAQQLGDEREAAREAARQAGEEPPPLTPEQRRFAETYRWYWMVFLVVLFLVIVLAGADLWSVRRYGMRQRRRLNEDRRAMIQRQLHRLRQERDERN